MRKFKLNKGFTIIEAMMFMLIIAVLAGTTAGLMALTVQNSIFIPNQLNMDKLACDALNIMIEGDSYAKGLRFARIINIISDNQISFVNQDGLVISYRLDSVSNVLFRQIGASAEEVIPSYASGLSGINLSGKDGVLFTYYNSVNMPTATAADARRIRIILIAKSGSGLYNDWQGQSEQASSVAFKKLE